MQYINSPKQRIAFDTIKLYALYGVVLTILLSRLNLNSICIIVFFAAWFFEGNFKEKWGLLKKDRLFLAYTLYFLVEVIGFFNGPDMERSWKNLESKVGYLAIPLVFCSSSFVTRAFRRKILLSLSIFVTIIITYCLLVALNHYTKTHDPEVFFYHTLVSPFDHHAVYFSVFTFISLVFLLVEGNKFPFFKRNKWIYVLWVLFHLGVLFLLSSKMALVVLIIMASYLVLRYYLTHKITRRRIIFLVSLIVLLTAGAFVIDNPVQKRFANLKEWNFSILKRDKYTPADYFDGLQFRLLLWRFTYEILNEKHAWLIGVGPSNAQATLREKYLSMNMYAGDPAKGDHGYLDYNCHNELLQTTLQMGILGTLAFLFWCYNLVRAAIRKQNLILSNIVIILLCFFFTDSVFEVQWGMILCTVFPLLFIYTKEEENKPAPANTQH